MAKRQQSFFDQSTAKKNIPWKKQWKPKNVASVSNQITRPSANMAPIAASSQTKSKLKAFEFYEEQGTHDASVEHDGKLEENKENVTDARIKQKPPSHPKTPAQPSSSQRSVWKESRDCPQTPLGRLPLSELLANNDDARQSLTFTPRERVLWENSSLSSGLTIKSPAKKKRKRAHSTSPASLSQNEASVHFVGSKPSNDPQGLQQKLETPKADPADDLWSRFSLYTTEKRSPSAPSGLPFPNFMHSSSPQTPAPILPRDASLRRALSCIEWPTSAAKRRKLNHDSGERKSAATFAESDDSAEKSKMKRVSVLVEKMHSGLSKSRMEPAYSSSEPAKSSPTEFRGESPAKEPAPSLSDDKKVEDVVTEMSQTTVHDQRDPSPTSLMLTEKEVAALQQAEIASDFDDDDLDDDMLEAADAEKQESLGAMGVSSRKSDLPLKIERARAERRAEDPAPNGSTHRTAIELDQRKQESTGTMDTSTRESDMPFKILHERTKGGIGAEHSVPQNSTVQRAIEPDDPEPRGNVAIDCPSQESKPHQTSDDEFDDDDGDEFAADLEEVFAKYETQQPAHDLEKIEGEVPLAAKEGLKEEQMQPENQLVEVLFSDDEDFGDDSDFEQLAAECANATQDQKVEAPSQMMRDRKAAASQRYIIKSIAENEYEAGGGRRYPQKILSVQCEKTKLTRAITLRQLWIDTPCKAGSYVHVVGDFDRYGQCVIDSAQNYVVLHPDYLISSTIVGDSFTCIRKSVLQDRIKTTSDANQGMVYGTILHEIFQEALTANQWDDDFMSSLIEKTATKYLEALFEINIEPAVAVEQLKARAVDLQAWANIFVAAKPKPNAVIRGRNGAQALMSINKLLEVEEHIWAPTFGLKGNIDATVQICLEDGDGQKTLTVPFELKTGKHSSSAHKAQTALYSLLLSDRYDVEVVCGILYYMQTSEISSICTIRHELMAMIIQRNQIAHHVRNRMELPTMLQKSYTCGKCYAQTPCFIYHKLAEDGNGESSGMGEKFDQTVRHLNPEHQKFFRNWDDLLTKEEADIVKIRKELWTMQSSEREKVGRCFGGLVVESGSFQLVEDASKINRFKYTLVRQTPKPGFTFTESQLTLGEPIVISDEQGHFALANGYVTRVREGKIQVTVDRRLHNARSKKKNFDAERNQVFSGIMEVLDKDGTQSTSTPTQLEEPVVYRLDKDEFSNGMAMVRNNLIRLMEKDVFGVQALRRLVVEGVAPTFNPPATGYTLGDSASQASLNVDQRAAIEKVMSAKDYALVLGMPGTGKTTTIAHIIRALVAQGKSVLLTSYTHTAVDNILLKLRNDKTGIFRLGATAKVHPEVQEFADLAGRPMKTLEELKRCYTQKVVATTCLGINHPIFNQRIFDYCIVDEASQITLPVCLGPIRMARTFILVGDHFQLPPLVQNKEALEGGLDVSLFKMLSDKHPSSVVNLEHQYRMCEDIMALSNTLVYNGRLKCGTQIVADRSICIPSIDGLNHHHHTAQSILSTQTKKICPSPSRGACWIRDLLDPSVKACFVNTDPLVPLSREVLEAGSRITNPCEVTLTGQLVESLLSTGIPPTDIGVMTLYRSQLALLKQSLRHRSGVEMHTADKFQGRDKEIIILSLVRSNEQQTVGELLKDWRRVNVALTRARTKLLVLGSKSTLMGNELLKGFMGLMEKKNWLYDLPSHATEGHLFEENGTQISGKTSFDAKTQSAKQPGGGRALADTLGLGKENRVGMKVPTKQSKLDVNVMMRKRPVLSDIVNDAS